MHSEMTIRKVFDMKRIVSFCFALLLCLAVLPSLHTAKADTFNPDSIYEPYYILVDANNPTAAYNGVEKEADKQVFPASTTKILSCIIALETGNLDDMVTVSAKAVDFGRGNSLMGLEEGDTFSMRDLLYGMMLPSGNDAAIAIAEHIAGSTDEFAALMNEKAQSLGMTHSHFVTVHGKQNDSHYTTVRDMARLTAYALCESPKSKEFREIVGTTSYTASSGPRALSFVNSNRMLIDMPPTEDLPNPISCLYPDAIGVKTGDTNAAGKCLIAAAEKEGVTLIAVLYGGTLDDPDYNDGWSDNRKDKYNARRFQDAAAMFDYAFADMTSTLTVADLVSYGMPVEFEVNISNASDNDSQGGVLKVRADLAMDTTITVMKPTLDGMRANMAAVANPTFTSIYAPIGDGSVVGSVVYSYNGQILLSSNLLATRSVKEGTAQIDIAEQTTSTGTSLIGDANTTAVVSETESDGGCGVPKNLRWVLIVLPIIFVLLILCVTMFIVYLNAEAKRRKREAARRKAAARRMRENGYDR